MGEYKVFNDRDAVLNFLKDKKHVERYNLFNNRRIIELYYELGKVVANFDAVWKDIINFLVNDEEMQDIYSTLGGNCLMEVMKYSKDMPEGFFSGITINTPVIFPSRKKPIVFPKNLFKESTITSKPGIQITSDNVEFEPECFANMTCTNVSLPDGITEIKDGMFNNSRIRTIVFPKSLTKISTPCFSGIQNRPFFKIRDEGKIDDIDVTESDFKSTQGFSTASLSGRVRSLIDDGGTNQ